MEKTTPRTRLHLPPPSAEGSWATSEASRRTMLGNRSKNTRPELALRRELRAVGLTGYRLRWPVPGAPRRSIDVAFVGRRIAVMVDGCFWHGCPEHGSAPSGNGGYWGPKLERNAARDRETTALLEDAGWTVLRFWSHANPAGCAAVVAHRCGAVSRRDPDFPLKLDEEGKNVMLDCPKI